MNLLRVLALSLTAAVVGMFPTATAQGNLTAFAGGALVAEIDGTSNLGSPGMSVSEAGNDYPKQTITIEGVAVAHADGDLVKLTEGVDYVVIHDGTTKPVILWDGILPPDKNYKIIIYGATNEHDLAGDEVDVEHLN